jgi:hypothetical protein
MIRKVTLILFLIICSSKVRGQEIVIRNGPIYFSSGIQITFKMLATYTSNQKSQPAFPNPIIIKGGYGSGNKVHAHSKKMFCRFWF